MDKIKITKNQEGILLNLLKDYGNVKAMKHRMEEGSFNLTFPKSKYTPEQFSLLLNGWYEVEQPFKVGDWVTTNIINREPKTGKIYEVKEGRDCEIFWIDRETKHGNHDVNVCADKIRHATPEEIEREKKRRFWDSMDRKEHEYKKYDIAKVGDFYGTVQHIEPNGTIRFMRFKDNFILTLCKEELDLVCRVEDRKDIKEIPF